MWLKLILTDKDLSQTRSEGRVSIPFNNLLMANCLARVGQVLNMQYIKMIFQKEFERRIEAFR